MKRTILMVLFIVFSPVICIPAGAVAGALFGVLLAGDIPIFALVGAMGSVAGTPFFIQAMRERWIDGQGDTLASDDRGEPSSSESTPRDEASPADPHADSRTLPGDGEGRLGIRWKALLGMLALVLLPHAFVAGWEYYTWFQLQRDGLLIPASVVMQGGSESWRSVSFVAYQFQIGPNGSVYGRTQEISQQTQQGLKLGDVVEVRYLPSNPAVSRLADESTYRVFLMRIAVVATVGYLIVAAWTLKTCR